MQHQTDKLNERKEGQTPPAGTRAEQRHFAETLLQRLLYCWEKEKEKKNITRAILYP